MNMNKHPGKNPAAVLDYGPGSLRLATIYFNFQKLNMLYPPEKGLKQGTIFPELDMPYGMNPEFMVDA